MLPVLISIGNLSFSSFGIFLSLGFLIGVFLIWRLCRAWDLDEEKVLDLTILTFLGGLLGARLFYAVENWELFSSAPLNLFLITKVPGFSFWGAFLGGWLTLFHFARRLKMDFWQLADIAAVGLLTGLIFGSLGCFLGGCNVGIQSNLFFATYMVGFVGKRFPLQLLEAFLLFWVLLRVWSAATHFHRRGQIVGLTLIYVGVIKFLVQPLKVSRSTDVLIPLALIFLGLTIFYKVTKRSFKADFTAFRIFLFKLVTDPKVRKIAFVRIEKNWYNWKTQIAWKARNFKKLLRRIHVKVS